MTISKTSINQHNQRIEFMQKCKEAIEKWNHPTIDEINAEEEILQIKQDQHEETIAEMLKKAETEDITTVTGYDVEACFLIKDIRKLLQKHKQSLAPKSRSVEELLQIETDKYNFIDHFALSIKEKDPPLCILEDNLKDLMFIKNSIKNLLIQTKLEKKAGQTQQEREKMEDEHQADIDRIDGTLALICNAIDAKKQCAPETPQHRAKPMKMETLKIPDFDGDMQTWPTFRDGFMALVHNNKDLSDFVKFTYLKQHLTDKNSPIASSLISEAGYTNAWDMVKKHYENDRVLIKHYFDEIQKIKKITNRSGAELKRISSAFKVQYEATKRIDTSVDLFDAFIAHILLFRLDDETQFLWESENDRNIPVVGKLLEFLQKQSEALSNTKTGESNKKHSSSGASPSNHHAPRATTKSFSSSNAPKKITPKCNLCNEAHWTFLCTKISNCSPTEAVHKIRAAKLCENCFGTHTVSECKSKSRCRVCQKPHNTKIHDAMGSASQSSFIASNSSNFHSSSNSFIMLSTATVNVKDARGKYIKARALLDSGSQSSFMTTKLVTKLCLPKSPIDIDGVGMGNNKFKINAIVNTSITNNAHYSTFSLNFLVKNELTGIIPNVSFPRDQFSIPEKFIHQLADPNFNSSANIDIIIGNEIIKKIELNEKIELDSGIILYETVFGYAISGSIHPLSSDGHCYAFAHNISAYTCLSDLRESVEKFYNLEDYRSEKRFLTPEELHCEQLFETTHKRLENGQFEVIIPYKTNVDCLANNYNVAYCQLVRSEKVLEKKPELKKQYTDFMIEYLDLHHMSEVNITDDPPNSSVYYLPHHAVIKDDSTTTKVRVVFNASSKTASGYSLNDVQCVGPTIQTDTFSLLIKFRMHRFIAKSDIAKMYRTISVNPEQRKLQRILWRDPDDHKIKCYELNTVTYGTAAASFQATRCLKELAGVYRDKYPEASQIIEKNSYVDDIFFGAHTPDELIQRSKELIKITDSAQMNLRKFSSNSKTFLDSLSSDRRESPSDEDSIYKALGIKWNATSDEISFCVSTSSLKKITKRSVLSEISKIFDPNGLLGPVTFAFKLFMKTVYLAKTSWDDTLPENLQQKWQDLSTSMHIITSIKLSRYALVTSPVRYQLHGFSDASNDGYGAAIYLRTEDKNGNVSVNLICSKSRISSNELRMPRLELCGGVILAYLITQVGNLLEINERFCWMDSMIALHWLTKEPANLQSFIANRVNEVKTTTRNSCVWRHIPGEENPADLLSRGMTPNELVNSNFWFFGPTFLQSHESSWPESLIDVKLDDPQISCEFKKVEVFHFQQNKRNEENILITMSSEISSFYKLRRIVAYITRFIHNSRAKRMNQTKRSFSKVAIMQHLQPVLTIEDLHDAEIVLCRAHQITYFASEFNDLRDKKLVASNSKIKNLSPFWDSSRSIIRVGGRLRNAATTHDQKFPIILPSCPFAIMIARKIHIENLHCGHRTTISIVNLKYWPLKLKSIVRKVIHDCINCYRCKPKLSNQLMGNLPSGRVQPSPPFYETGCDYAGPINIKTSQLRTAKSVPAYLAIFVCFSTKAIHIEVVTALTTEAFLNSFKRFISRRGKPKQMHSDNGTNFVGAKNELSKLYDFISKSSDQIKQYFEQHSIEWKLIPPRAPHHGGLWESAVKSIKNHLFPTIGTSTLTYEEITTICCQIEAILNSRPLTYYNDDPNDPHPLTPGHFLIGRELVALPEDDLTQQKVLPARRYRRMMQIQQHFWDRWSREYLCQLQVKNKDYKKIEDFKEGQVVMICDENRPPLYWPFAVIIKVHPDPQGIVRTVTLRTQKGKFFDRPITKIAILPINEDINTQHSAPGIC